MTAALGGAVELLDRSLAYTRVSLADVDPDPRSPAWHAPTPCGQWDLIRLLDHMDDALDAFTEAASGYVAISAPPPTAHPLLTLRDKACALLGAWASVAQGHDPDDPDVAGADVRVGDLHLAGPILVATAALEITVHGWDVAQSTGAGRRIPEDLARGLLDIARVAVEEADRGVRFARPRPVDAGASYDVRLLHFLGREPALGRRPGADLTGPPGGNRRDRDPRPDVAS